MLTLLLLLQIIKSLISIVWLFINDQKLNYGHRKFIHKKIKSPIKIANRIPQAQGQLSLSQQKTIRNFPSE